MNNVKVYVIAGTMCNEKIWHLAKTKLGPNIQLEHLGIPKNMTFDEICIQLNEIIGEQKINLLGFSLGGYIAAYFSVLFPTKVRKLFVVSNSPTTLPEKELQQRKQVLAFIQNFGYRGLSAELAASLLECTSRKPSLIALLQEMDRDLGTDELISQYTYTTQRRCLKANLLALEIPIVFWFSRNDTLINHNWFSNGIDSPFVNLVIREGDGHMLPIEQPGELVHLVGAWLQQSQPKS
ncbi:hypothetical protein N480_04310 [Pseudoalteromonas luteoviolacea S2607]|uniref:alpha/beta fold hydrolase n=1 Tax=Pseudoalteromonas luteoviolacea TaxID=43657 RepID=UPI0007B0A743|nr:alpha/beta hydrolase [Pseudoalteromonas luteoviolacea]KZN30179.1 hypothetical protein N480_04310 [Pseudoalteromonas luteoviolacea S2607]